MMSHSKFAMFTVYVNLGQGWGGYILLNAQLDVTFCIIVIAILIAGWFSVLSLPIYLSIRLSIYSSIPIYLHFISNDWCWDAPFFGCIYRLLPAEFAAVHFSSPRSFLPWKRQVTMIYTLIFHWIGLSANLLKTMFFYMFWPLNM